MKIMILAVLAALSLNAHAADTCSLNFNALKSAINVSGQFSKLDTVKINKKAKILSQTGLLKSGEAVRYTAGGCEHLAITYSYKIQNKASDGKAVAALLAQLLTKTPVISDAKGTRDMFIAQLKDAAKNGANLSEVQPENRKAYSIPCGDGYCEAQVNSNEISYSYDFAL